MRSRSKPKRVNPASSNSTRSKNSSSRARALASSARSKKLKHSSRNTCARTTTLWSQLRPLQKKAVEFVVEVKTAALFFKQRLGKTWISLGVIERLDLDYSLLVVPLTNKETTWQATIAEKLPQFECFTDLESFDIARKDGRKRLILVVHYEQMVSIIKKLCKRPWSFVSIDEAHRLKDRTSRQSKAAARLSRCEYKLILTGTPLEQKPQDCWAQFRFLLPVLFGTRWADFEEKYIEPPSIDLDEINPRTGKPKYPRGSMRWKKALFAVKIERKKRKFKKDMLPEFVRLLKPYAWREELKSPEPIMTIEWVRMYGYQRQLYDTFQKKSIATLPDGTTLKAELAAVKKVKLHQICGGIVLDDDRNEHEVGRAKLRKTLSVVKKNGGPFVIFCHHTAEINSLLEELKGRIGVISGKHKKTRAQTQRDFQAGKLDGLICQVRSGSVGVDLFRAKYLIVHSTTYSLIDFDQLIARIRLPDQTEPTRIFLILVRDSVDEDKYSMIVEKDHEVGAILTKLKR